MKLKRTIFPVDIEFSIKGELQNPDNIGECFITTNKKGNAVIHIHVLSLKSAEDHSVLVHEISHCVDYIEELIEGRLDTETRAYLSQNIYKQIATRN